MCCYSLLLYHATGKLLQMLWKTSSLTQKEATRPILSIFLNIISVGIRSTLQWPQLSWHCRICQSLLIMIHRRGSHWKLWLRKFTPNTVSLLVWVNNSKIQVQKHVTNYISYFADPHADVSSLTTAGSQSEKPDTVIAVNGSTWRSVV